VSTDGAFVAGFRFLARELEMAIAVTYLQAWPGAPRNVVSLVDRHGEIVFTYAKVHTCDFDHREAACTPGEDFCVAPLDTAAGPVKTGAMICFDREFPESARVLMLKGAWSAWRWPTMPGRATRVARWLTTRSLSPPGARGTPR
jgi:predicted amidohydrolase